MTRSPASSAPAQAAALRALSTDLQIRKRKLEKADILELSVKYMKSLQNSVQGSGMAWGVGRRGGGTCGVRAMDSTRPDKGGMDGEELLRSVGS